MSNAFFDDAENRVVLQICRTSPGFIPIVMGGMLHPVRETSNANYPVSANLSAGDYVLGLEVLGCKLVRNEVDVVVVREPASFVRETWRIRARQIQVVMTDDWEGRRTDLSDYLHARHGERT
ncbi:hypothetical protein [uncultured Aureimonas sp.]|uniref:hypothetical protein n=1 Tax=uncultured Aureimonas sp. TaxID=1604662 RepID=UPI0025FCE7E1|nr:hypothetical protein [uncultured Aureimonas sp.]